MIFYTTQYRIIVTDHDAALLVLLPGGTFSGSAPAFRPSTLPLPCPQPPWLPVPFGLPALRLVGFLSDRNTNIHLYCFFVKHFRCFFYYFFPKKERPPSGDLRFSVTALYLTHGRAGRSAYKAAEISRRSGHKGAAFAVAPPSASGGLLQFRPKR